MTVEELRRRLAEWPDHAPVVIVNEDLGWRGIKSTEPGPPRPTKPFFIYLTTGLSENDVVAALAPGWTR